MKRLAHFAAVQNVAGSEIWCYDRNLAASATQKATWKGAKGN